MMSKLRTSTPYLLILVFIQVVAVVLSVLLFIVLPTFVVTFSKVATEQKWIDASPWNSEALKEVPKLLDNGWTLEGIGTDQCGNVWVDLSRKHVEFPDWEKFR